MDRGGRGRGRGNGKGGNPYRVREKPKIFYENHPMYTACSTYMVAFGYDAGSAVIPRSLQGRNLWHLPFIFLWKGSEEKVRTETPSVSRVVPINSARGYEEFAGEN